ncbi:MAG: siphovirus ReqiPepy6 Gp37-like family protein [Bacteroidaceae bacterium]|nr:siphovirus ReqiPepy6 Gp37-like family protein [Bacteroidaceae bacterium]
MILHVFDDTFTYRGRVEDWINMTWTEEYKGEGKFTLVTYDTDKYAELLRHGWYFYRTDRKTAMMAVKVERDTDKNTITVCGYTALHLLTRRIIDLTYTCTNVEAGIYAMIGGDLRGLNQIVCAPSKGLKAECEFEIEGEVMLDAVLSLLNESDYGIRANFDYENKRHVIEVYEGVDRSYNSESGGTVFSQEFGNLKSLVVTEDDDLYKNVAYVTGSDNSDPRTIYYQYVSPDAGPQSNWREMLVSGENQEEDESTEEWQKRQKQIAIKALQERKNACTFEVELSLGIFGEKYELGDKVTCRSKRYGLHFDTQITEYQYSYKNGVESVKITIGEKPVNFVKGEIIRNG